MATLAIWCDGAADGPTNMAADELLAAEARLRGEPLVRLYRWISPTVSLGAFQPLAGLPAFSRDPAAREPDCFPFPLVRRPSGGAAIVHGTDLSYALALPAGHAWSRSAAALYAAVHGPLVAELVARGVEARVHDGAEGGGALTVRGKSQPWPFSTRATPENATGFWGCPSPHPAAGDIIQGPLTDEAGAGSAFFCFSRRAPGDVVVSPSGRDRGEEELPDCKVLGAAQRRLAGVTLQHGSLLVHTNASVPPTWRHGGLDGLGIPLDDGGDELAWAWLARVSAALDRRPERQAGAFVADPARGVEVAARASRYREAGWLARR